MRVLLLFSSSELGGAERSLTRMAFVHTSIDYHLGTLDGEGPWCDWVRSMGREPVVFGSRKIANVHRKYDLKAIAALMSYVHRARIEAIYVCGFVAAFVLRWLKVFMPGVKLIQGVRWNPDSNINLDRVFRLSERLFHGLMDGYITNSKAAANTLVQRCKISQQNISVIYNGLVELPTDIPSIKARPLEVLTVANLNPRKGHREYLKAVQLVLAAVPDAKFLFVGRDDMNGAVQRAIEEERLAHAVRCEGFQPDVSVYFRRARICVLPSLWGEGCPTSLLESFSWGVPTVAYGIDGVPELIENSVDGFVASLGDYKELANRIISLLVDVELAERYGTAGRKKVFEKFSVNYCADAHAAFFNA